MAEKFNVTGEQYFLIDGLLIKLKRLITDPRGCFFNPIWISWGLQDIIENRYGGKLVTVPRTTRYSVSKNNFFKIDGQFFEIKRQIRLKKSGSPLDPVFVIAALQNLVAGKFNCSSRILRKITKKCFVIPSLSGKEVIASANKLFSYGIDNNFENEKILVPTKETQIYLYELSRDATLLEIFHSLSPEMCLTEHQIISFCSNYMTEFELENNGCVLIPFRNPKEMAVAAVYDSADGLSVVKYSISDTTHWHADDPIIIVAPPSFQS